MYNLVNSKINNNNNNINIDDDDDDDDNDNNNNNNNSLFILGNNVQLKSTQNNKTKTFTPK